MAGRTPSSGVAIIGSGVAGLHLALLLQKQGIPVTLYSDKTAAQLASGRMLNTVAHHNTTVKAAARRANRVRAISDWTNLMIALPPAPHLLQLLGAMSQNPAVADEFTDNFNQPERQWDILATPERTSAFLARHGM